MGHTTLKPLDSKSKQLRDITVTLLQATMSSAVTNENTGAEDPIIDDGEEDSKVRLLLELASSDTHYILLPSGNFTHEAEGRRDGERGNKTARTTSCCRNGE